MKVTAKPSAPSVVGWLDENEPSTVLALYVGPGEGGKYLIWSAKQESVALFPSVDFDVIDGHISPRWTLTSDPQGGLYLAPEIWKIDGFWEKYNDGDAEAERIFEKEKELILND